jgi:hypothetical protein
MSIVQINLSLTQAPAPSLQQKKGAVISQGGSTLVAPATMLITQLSDYTAIAKAALPITTLVWVDEVVTATTPAPHGIPVEDIVHLTIAGATPAGFNGTFACTSTGADTFTYPLLANPGAQTVAGTYIPAAVAGLTAKFTTIFAQGSQQAVTLLELGLANPAAGVTALGTFIGANTVKGTPPFYAYLIPAEWDAEATFLPFAATLSSLTAMTYFFQTTTLGTFAAIPPTTKSINAMVPAPSVPATEFSHAADFRALLNYSPSSTNKVTPFDNTALVAVTPYPTVGNSAIIAELLAANINIVSTGSEGGLTNLILNDGTTMDGNDQTFWYAIDWLNINAHMQTAAAVINGANNPQAPLDYDQDGIDQLQGVLATTVSQGVNFNLILGAPTQVQMDPSDFIAAVEAGTFAGQTAINAQTFLNYSAANPDDFEEGLYTGFQIAFTPARGFKTIIININVTEFVTTA